MLNLQLSRNELGLLEFNGKGDLIEISDSDDSDSIDLTCQENPPSSPSMLRLKNWFSY